MKVLYQRISKYISIEKNNTKNIRIYLYQKNNTNEYPNIFLSKKWYERIDEYICIKEKFTNEYSNKLDILLFMHRIQASSDPRI